MRRIAPLLLLFGSLACEDAFDPGPRAPVIREARPPTARVGQRVTLIGSGFGVQGELDRVWLGGNPVPVESWTDTALLVTVPPAVGRGIFDFVVRAGAQVGPPFPFEVQRSQEPDAGM
ncbi:MAG: IPT/TIG domain-containing protein [Myxococcales bacterium]|nr:IPT/TIG domain-containing protein [Myxococcales bacterium]MCB9526615.1 IPT/TIG domain-containing protein [Myxococcales bacterium]